MLFTLRACAGILALCAASAASAQQQSFPGATDGVLVQVPPRKPIAWGASDAFKLKYDLRHWHAEPAVQVDPALVERHRQARDESLARAYDRLIERSQLAGREAPGQSSVGQ
jgi:hypothetical protein